MLWQSINGDFNACQCKRVMKNSFQINENKFHNADCGYFNHSDCTPPNTFESEIDKENTHFGSPGKHDSDISLYGNTSPSSTKYSMICSPLTPTRQPLAEFDLNSQDSGYGTSFTDKENSVFQFLQTEGTRNIAAGSPRKKCANVLFNSFSSVESMDDGFLELPWKTEMGTMASELPCNFNNLLSGNIKTITPLSATNTNTSTNTNTQQRPGFRRSVSLREESVTSVSGRARHCLFESSLPEIFETRAFKRPEPPTDIVSPVHSKRYKCTEKSSPPRERPKVLRSLSATEESIMSAVQRSSTDPGLIGDFSKPFCLPLVSGRHQDLKSISSATLADLMRGCFDHCVASHKIIDCRYPYEFKGGHINGALNFYTKDQIIAELVESKCAPPQVEPDTSKRHILVFHCEFSSERGPNLSRFLRNHDRTRNNDAYPALHYPEIYLLDGGYKNFYEQFADLCEPVAYKPMLDPAHEHDLRHFRAKSKTWNSDTRGRPQLRSTFKRLGFP